MAAASLSCNIRTLTSPNMHTVKIVLILAAAIAPQAVFAQVGGNHAIRPSEIDVRRNGDNGYRLILKSYRSSTVPAGREELWPKVAVVK